MSVRVCRVFPFRSGDGPENMALDEAMLEEASVPGATPVLRFYSWSVPTLSLGYFQSASVMRREDRWIGVPLVRRSTGGGALWHEHEITYAAALPSTEALARRSKDLYREIHLAAARALREVGLDAELRGDEVSPAGRVRSEGEFLCFSDRSPEDLTARGVKIVGSAQRRRAGAVLQHGALLLRSAAKTPELPGIEDVVAGLDRGVQDWVVLLRAMIPAALGLTPSDAEPSSRTLSRAAELAAEVYRSDAWTYKR